MGYCQAQIYLVIHDIVTRMLQECYKNVTRMSIERKKRSRTALETDKSIEKSQEKNDEK